jgi:hypothetical protein
MRSACARVFFRNSPMRRCARRCPRPHKYYRVRPPAPGLRSAYDADVRGADLLDPRRPARTVAAILMVAAAESVHDPAGASNCAQRLRSCSCAGRSFSGDRRHAATAD